MYENSIISDTSSWTTIRGSFIADSAYQYIVIGNFFDDSLTSSYLINPFGSFALSYYYVDDICVSSDSLTCEGLTSVGGAEKSIDFEIFPNPCSSSLTIDLTNFECQEITSQIFDVNGIPVNDSKIVLQPTKHTYDVSNLLKGVYVLVVNCDTTIKRRIFIKQ